MFRKYMSNIYRAVTALFSFESGENPLLAFLVRLDRLANALLCGDPDETISSRVARWSNRNIHARVTCKLLNWLFFWQKTDHCASAIQKAEGDDTVSDHPIIFVIVLFGTAWLTFELYTSDLGRLLIGLFS